MNYLVDVDQTDPDLIAYFSPNAFVSTTPDPGRVTNLTGSYLDADFGFFKNLPGSIGDAVCRDTNSDGLCTGTDTGIPNVTVWLYRDADADGMPDAEELAITATTSITGYYSFTGLGPDNYIVVVDTTDPDWRTGIRR